MKILLVAINSKYIHSNLAVYSLQAYASKYKEEIELAEYTINQQVDDILMDIYKQKPDILCFSCYIWNLSYVEELSREYGRLCPQTKIWIGGPEVSYDASAVLRRLPEVTGVICGEGEETFLELLDYYHGEAESLEQIQGIAWRKDDGELQVNPWRPVMDLSRVPFVYQDMEPFRNKIIYYETSRGCPFSCSYCLSSVDKKLRFRDLDLVKQELQHFIDHEVAQVKFVDRTFNCRHEHAMAIWTYLMEHDNGKTNFHFEVAADLLTEEEITLLAKMRPGLVQLEIGVQSTYEPTIHAIRRTMKFEKVASVVKQIQKVGNIHQHLDLIAGLPYEDLATFRQSFDDVYGLHPEQLQLGFLKVLKGSYMEEKAEDYGLVYKMTPPYEVRKTRWLSYEDVLELKAVEEMVEIYYNSGQFTYTMRKLEAFYPSAYEMYRKLAEHYEQHQLHMMKHARVTRYEILLDYIKLWHPAEVEIFREILVLDYYLRENAKTRPAFAGEYRIEKEELANYYKDKKQARKNTHMERFTCMVTEDCRKQSLTLLFDYEQRNPLTHDALVEVVG